MVWEGKNPLNLLEKTALISTMGLSLAFASCNPEEKIITDTISPKITVYSPTEKKQYASDTIPFEWIIEEENFKNALYTIDNYKTKVPIEQSGKENLILKNGDWSLILYTEDKSNNWDEEKVNFSVNKLIKIDPFVSPGANGAVYNALTTKTERDAYIQQKLYEDWVNTIPYTSPNFVCDNYAMNLIVNSTELGKEIHTRSKQWGRDFLYNNYKGDRIDSIIINGGSLRTKGSIGIPILFVGLIDSSHYTKPIRHMMNGVVTRASLRKLEDITLIEPQLDLINVKYGEANLKENMDEINIYSLEIYQDIDNKEYTRLVPLVKFKVEKGISTIIWENNDPAYSIRKER